jgi:hypothetical protein
MAILVARLQPNPQKTWISKNVAMRTSDLPQLLFVGKVTTHVNKTSTSLSKSIQTPWQSIRTAGYQRQRRSLGLPPSFWTSSSLRRICCSKKILAVDAVTPLPTLFSLQSASNHEICTGGWGGGGGKGRVGEEICRTLENCLKMYVRW